MVITNTQENTKPPGRTHGLRPAHETARTLRHHYERKSCERVKDAYSIPHPVPPKITPRARMVPATAPISLLVATLTVQREKEHYYHPVKNKQQASASESWMKWHGSLCDASHPLYRHPHPVHLLKLNKCNTAFILSFSRHFTRSNSVTENDIAILKNKNTVYKSAWILARLNQ